MSLTLLNTISASNQLTMVDLTGLASGFKHYEIILDFVLPVNNNVALYLNFYNGTTWPSSSYYSTGSYSDTYWILNNSSSIQLTGAVISNSSSYGGVSGIIRISNPTVSGTYKKIISLLGAWNGSYPYGHFGSGTYVGDTNPITRFNIVFGSGNISTGTIYIYGWN